MAGAASPRQKMINLMYLVLLALLAMNVSKEILNSFAILNNGLIKTNESFAAKNESTYNSFELALMNDKVKVRPYYDKALLVKKRSKELFDYIEELKKELIFKVEGKNEITVENHLGQDSVVTIASDIFHMETKDDNNTPTIFFMGTADDEAPPGTKAYELKEKIKKYKEDVMTCIDPKDRQNIRLGLDIKDIYSAAEGQMVKWEVNVFYHCPVVAVISLLTKMQNDVKNVEADIVNSLYKRIDVSSFKFDTLSARVVANSNYVLIGEEYRAEVFMAAFSTTSNPTIWLGAVDSSANKIKGPIDSTAVTVSKGVGTYIISPSTEGTIQWGGLIRMKDPADPTIIHAYPFKSEYKSARPAIVVSPDKMNVFYIGLDNPVSISVPGIAAEDIQPSLSGKGSMSGSRGKYIVRVGAGKECVINVSARTRTGTKSMGQGVKFRVKPVPNPVPEFMGNRGTSNIKQADIKYAKGVIAKLDNFEFDVSFPVVSFDVTMNINGLDFTESTTGASLTDKQKTLISKTKKGSRVYIEKVKAKKPDGNVVDIGSVNLKVI
ncbi:MAG: gliding motility protein GldM [Bacteroidota bacterium]